MSGKQSHERRWRLAGRNAALQIALEAAAASHGGELPIPCQDLLDELLVVDLFSIDLTREIEAALLDLDRIAAERRAAARGRS
jgi:hypothetical protein